MPVTTKNEPMLAMIRQLIENKHNEVGTFHVEILNAQLEKLDEELEELSQATAMGDAEKQHMIQVKQTAHSTMKDKLDTARNKFVSSTSELSKKLSNIATVSENLNISNYLIELRQNTPV